MVHGTGTATLDSKLIQQLTAMREEVLYEIFLDLQKACAALEWDRCLEIIKEYGVVPRALRIIQMYWKWITMIARAGGYYKPPLKGYRGITQG